MTPHARRPYRRRQLIVNRPLQFRFNKAMLGILYVLTFIALGSVYLTLWMILQTFGLQHDPVTVALFSTIGWSIALELLLVGPFVVWLGVLLTHKVAGPLVRVHAALAQLTQGNFNIRISLRKGDSLTDLADAVNTLADSLQRRKS
jgi:signal transduction histidine kinase